MHCAFTWIDSIAFLSNFLHHALLKFSAFFISLNFLRKQIDQFRSTMRGKIGFCITEVFNAILYDHLA